MTASHEIKKPHEIKNTNEALTFNQKLYEFVQKNRKTLFISFIAMIVIIAGLIIFITVRDRMQANALSRVDEFSRRYEEVKDHIIGGDLMQQAEIAILLAELQDFQNRTSGFPAARAFSITAEILTEQGNWAGAETAWSNAARTAEGNYLTPIALFNAAVAAEEQGNVQAAIDYYIRAIGFGELFHSAARAQFAIGRLEEGRSSREAALAAYRNLLARWPEDPVWSNLAQNRIIMLGE